MTVDPRVGFWFSIVMAIVSALGVCGTQFTTLFGEVVSNKILAAIVILNVINGAINAILHMIPSKPGAANEFALGPKAVPIILFALILGALAFPGNAMAQVKLKTPGQVVSDVQRVLNPGAVASPIASLDATLNSLGQKLQAIEKDVADKVITDAKNAIIDGNNHNDDISVPCWTAIQTLATNLPAEWETPPTLPMGIMLAIQVQRDLLAAITGTQKTSLKVACAALWGDQLAQIGQLGLLFGFAL